MKGPIPKPMIDRFWSSVNIPEDPSACWISKKFKTKNGHRRYGQTVDDSGKKKYKHRLSWEIHFGSIPKGYLVLHTCDNPPCVNPKHFVLGTYRTNAIDKVKKGRHPRTRDKIFRCKNGHLFSKYGKVRPDGKRYCFECHSNMSKKDRPTLRSL